MRSRFFSEAVVFLLLATVVAAVSNALAGPQRKLRWFGAYTESVPRSSGAAASPPTASAPAAGTAEKGKAFPPHPDKAWLEISGDQAAELFGRKTVPFLDARRTAVYGQGHVAGARPFSVWEADADDKVKAFFQEGPDQSAPVVVYCSGGDCEDSHMLAEKLYKVGFDNVLVYKDGFPDWQKRALPVTQGANP